ncbi:hypothetical protein OSB04_017367 [Centaurea solstitialis]|uniref:Trehalose 6-phosphate phosphatase n=1 Tax=Centaurea solstitialis TaxID=347529 RepID=A0AA38WAM5_9ASTR|nr:hypothetical protein OSB04_017367 [Centaurea solstitialis]
MHLKSNQGDPVLADPMNNSRLGLYDALLPYSSGAVLSPGLFLTVTWKKPSAHSEVLSTSWLDAMQSSSPTHRKLTFDSGIDISSNDVAVAYGNWMLKYPSALTSFDHIINNAKGKRIALFLDYDGTLSPIVDNPDHAFMSDAMRAAVKNVAKDIPTAIISGRSRVKVHEFVGLRELYYAGSHGMDIMGPARPADNHTDAIISGKEGEEGNLFQPASEFLPMINQVFTSLVEITKDIKGAKVENNKFCVSVHYRNVDEKSWPTIAQYVHDILKQYPRLRLTHGRKVQNLGFSCGIYVLLSFELMVKAHGDDQVLEVRPVLKWDKGKAVEFLLESLGLGDCDDVVPIYVGDDRTDEDAFKLLREGGRGFGILVSSAPKESSAFYSLRDPSEVMEFLKLLGDDHNKWR